MTQMFILCVIFALTSQIFRIIRHVYTDLIYQNYNNLLWFIFPARKISTLSVAKSPVNRYNIKSKDIIVLVAEYEHLRLFSF